MRHAHLAGVRSKQIVICGEGEIMAIQKKSLRGGSKASKNAKASTGAVKRKVTPRDAKEVHLNTGVAKLPAVQ
jgi:hypothetical protein